MFIYGALLITYLLSPMTLFSSDCTHIVSYSFSSSLFLCFSRNYFLLDLQFFCLWFVYLCGPLYVALILRSFINCSFFTLYSLLEQSHLRLRLQLCANDLGIITYSLNRMPWAPGLYSHLPISLFHFDDIKLNLSKWVLITYLMLLSLI